MNSERFQFLSLTTLPARLNVEETGWYLAFKTKEIPRLTKAKLLTPLGHPGPTAAKYYAESELRLLRNDLPWLHKATDVTLGYWQRVHERQHKRRKR
jgi:hypothetical protein